MNKDSVENKNNIVDENLNDLKANKVQELNGKTQNNQENNNLLLEENSNINQAIDPGQE